jgi:hypothetical protein
MPCASKGQILLCKKQSDSTKKLSEADIINMLEFLIDNIFAMCDGRASDSHHTSSSQCHSNSEASFCAL